LGIYQHFHRLLFWHRKGSSVLL